MQEPRLAHPRLCRDIDDAKLGAGFVEPAFQHLHFPLAADEGAKSTAYSSFKSCGPNTESVKPKDLLRLGFTLDGVFARKACIDHPLHQAMRRLAQKD